MATLDVNVSETPEATIVTLRGEALVELEPLVATLQGVTSKQPDLAVLDLKELSFISSLAMGVMLAFRRSVLAAGGKLRVANMQKLVLDSFKRARLDKVFEISDSVDAALGK